MPHDPPTPDPTADALTAAGPHAHPAPAHQAEHLFGSAFASAAAVLFGSAYVATAFALQSFSPLAVGFWRGAGATAVLLLVVAVRGSSPWSALRALDRHGLARLLVLGLLAGPLFVIGMNVAVAEAGATIAAFVAGLYAVVAAILAPWLLRERLGRSALAGFLVALVGTALLAELDLRSGSAVGIVAGLGAAAAFGLHLVLSRRWAAERALPGDLVALGVNLLNAAVLLPLALVVDPAAVLPAAPSAEAVLAIGWLVVGPSALAQLFIQASVRRIRARRSSAFLLLNPISASILGAILLGERLSPAQLAGAVLVLGGMAASSGILALRRR